MKQRPIFAAIKASAQGDSPDVLTEHGSIVVNTSAKDKISSRSESVAVGKIAESSAVESARALYSAFASACVFPGSSLEKPVARTIRFCSPGGHRTARTHPTQKAVGVGSHFSASKIAKRINERS